MPYIDENKRLELDGLIKTLSDHCDSAGEMNYVITKFIHTKMIECQLRYDTINEVIGVLECAKLELYRMVAAPYEDRKRAENGHISNLDHDLGER